MTKILLAFVCSLVAGVAIAPPIIFLVKKLKARQTILSYVEQHKDKEGIPTMGGIIFILPTVVFSFAFWQGEKKLAFVALMVTAAYGIIGGLDDLIKVVFKRNLGLKAYQKIISQLVIAALVTVFAYKNGYVGTEVYIPIAKVYVDIKWGFIPLSVFIFLAVTNCVNLTDGLDGLAGSSVAIYLAAFFIITLGIYIQAKDLGQTLYSQEAYNLLIFIAALIGGIVAFLFFNSHKAKIFMGDTGSLALGGACAAVPVFIKNPFLICIVGIVFVASGLSVIIQVISFKTRKKRIFLMAPLHHHLEMKGICESKIVSVYSIITALFGVVGMLLI